MATPKPRCQVAIHKWQTYALLDSITIEPEESIPNFVLRLQSLYFRGTWCERALFAVYRAVTGQKVAVSLAPRSSVVDLDPESALPTRRRRVILAHKDHDQFLTLAFHNTHQLFKHAPPLASIYPDVFEDRPGSEKLNEPKYLVLSPALCPLRGFIAFAVSALLALLPGIGFSIAFDSQEMGMSIFGLVLGIMSILQGSLLFFHG